MTEQKCPDCGEQMEEGFIPDVGYGGIAQTDWHRGQPVPSLFLGIKQIGIKMDRKELIPLAAYRCTGCGAVRLYANEQDA